MPRLRPAPKEKVSVDKMDSSESGSALFENKTETAEPELHENVEAAPGGPIEVEIAPKEAKVEKVEEPKEDPALALQKQLDELKKSEEIQRTQAAQAIRERDEAIKRAQEREVEVVKLQKETTQSHYDQIASALAAAQADAERAAQDVEVAGNASDFKALADAQRRLARAESRIDKMEDGKFELEARLQAEKAAPRVEPKVESPPQQPTIDQVIDSWRLPEITTKYLKANPGYVADPSKLDVLKYWNQKAVKSGLTVHSQAFIDYVDEKMKLEENPPKEEPQQEQQRTNIVSAPVSREVPSGGTGTRSNGKVTLTAAEREFAKISGITEAEYARQKQKLQEMKANGSYSDGRQ
jgi:hypothetical protein